MSRPHHHEPQGARPTSLAVALALMLLLAPAEGVRAKDRHEGAAWLVNQIAVPLSERFSFHTMVQNRWIDDVDYYERTVVRPWFAFEWTEHVGLALGYDRHEFKDGLDEDRAWQRIEYRHGLEETRFGEPTLFTHFWLEERFFERTKRISWRGRFQIGGSLELPSGFGFLLRNEFFVDFNETSRVRKTGLGENQLYAGFFHPLTDWLRFDVGYLMQYRDQKEQDLYDHGVSLGFSIRTPSLGALF